MYFEIGMILALALVFFTGLGFAVYGLISFIRKRTGKRRPDIASGQALSPRRADGAPAYSPEPESAYADPVPPHAAATPSSAPGTAPQRDAALGNALSQGAAGRLTPRESAWHPHHPAIRPTGPVMDKLFIRCLVIASITLGLLIPLYFVSDIVDERSMLRRKAVDDIAGLWGHSQTVNGPALVIPYLLEYSYKEKVKNDDGKEVTETRRAVTWEYKVALPADVAFTAALDPQKRRRGIYEYVVYTATVDIAGRFRIPAASSFGEDAVRIDWENAWMALGITDLRAITDVKPLIWNGEPCPPYNPGTRLKTLLGPGFHAPVALAPAKGGAEESFSLSLHLNGSGGMHFTPVGESTQITVSGPWPHPSFSGSLLPTNRTISDTEFSAHWRIPHLSRTYPQSGVLGKDDFAGDAVRDFTAGVNLFETVSLYSQVNRAVKYGLLFIGLTFTALLSFELVSRVRLHMMQYALVGIAMTLFYLTLLSLAEHTVFLAAFAAAALLCILMNSLYIAAAMRSARKGLIVAGLLTALYLLLYALLQMEEYALIIGTALVLLVVGILMYLTRHLPERDEAPAAPNPDNI